MFEVVYIEGVELIPSNVWNTEKFESFFTFLDSLLQDGVDLRVEVAAAGILSVTLLLLMHRWLDELLSLL